VRIALAHHGVPQPSEQKRTLSRADCQVVTVIGVTHRPQFTLSDAVSERERVAPQATLWLAEWLTSFTVPPSRPEALLAIP